MHCKICDQHIWNCPEVNKALFVNDSISSQLFESFQGAVTKPAPNTDRISDYLMKDNVTACFYTDGHVNLT